MDGITNSLRPAAFELPESFARKYRPIKAHADQHGVAGYLFEPFELSFYRRRTATASQVGSRAVWSVTAGPTVLILSSGELDMALGYIVTEVAILPSLESSYSLARCLSYSQKADAPSCALC